MAVIDTKIKPRRVRLWLDGSLIGVADDFDGKPDYLYLRPGRYRLEGRLHGYRTDVFEIEAQDGCRYDIKHWMTKSRDTKMEPDPAPPRPVQRVFETVSGGGTADEPPPPAAAPDPRLRPDLGTRSRPPMATQVRVGASLRVLVEPLDAAVTVDGEYVATGAELARMTQALAVAPGAHLIEVAAAGYRPHRLEIELVKGELKEINIVLSAETPGDNR